MGRSGRLLFTSFAAVVASFVVAQVIEQFVSRSVDASSDDIVNITSPSIEHLAALRGDTRQVEFLLDAWVDDAAAGKVTSMQPLEEALARLSAEEHAYVTLPRLADEDPLWHRVQDETAAFVRATQRAIAEVEVGAPARAQHTVAVDVNRAADSLADAAYETIEHHARRGAELAAQIKADRHFTLTLAWILDGVCAAFAIVAATLIWRTLRSTEALRASNERLLQRRADELESFAGRVAHDILSPLGAVRLSVDLALRTTDGRTGELLVRGQRALKRVENLTDALLAFAKAAARPPEGVSAEVRPVVEGVLDELREQADEARVEVVAEPLPDAQVACSAGILTSLLQNLLRNALKYMGDGGERRVTVRVCPRGARWRFEVQDTGPGIPPNLADRIFEPYVRGPGAGGQGLGLGLATVKRLADSHGGSVGVVSRPGHGALFWFELPDAGPVAGAQVVPLHH